MCCKRDLVCSSHMLCHLGCANAALCPLHVSPSIRCKDKRTVYLIFSFPIIRSYMGTSISKGNEQSEGIVEVQADPRDTSRRGDLSNRGSRQHSISSFLGGDQQVWDRALDVEYAAESHAFREGMHPAVRPVMKQDAAVEAEVTVEEPEPTKYFDWKTYVFSLPVKVRGGLDTRLPIPPFRELVFSFIGSFVGIFCVSAAQQFWSPDVDIVFLVASFGASAVLIYGLPESKLSQPRNFVGGQVLSALTGVIVRLIIRVPWVASPVAMSCSLVVMFLTSTTHPPGGATAIIISSMEELPKWGGFSYVVGVGFGSLIMLAVALIVNNLNPSRRYPTFWY